MRVGGLNKQHIAKEILEVWGNFTLKSWFGLNGIWRE